MDYLFLCEMCKKLHFNFFALLVAAISIGKLAAQSNEVPPRASTLNLPPREMTQGDMLAIAKAGEIKEFKLQVPESRLVSGGRSFVRLGSDVEKKVNGHRARTRGRLIGIMDQGIFLFDQKKSICTYFPYSKLRFIQRGVPLIKLLGGEALGLVGLGTVAGFVVGVIDDEIGSYTALGALGGAVVCGFVAAYTIPIYGLYTVVPSIRYSFQLKESRGVLYRKLMKKRKFGQRLMVDFDNFPQDTAVSFSGMQPLFVGRPVQVQKGPNLESIEISKSESKSGVVIYDSSQVDNSYGRLDGIAISEIKNEAKDSVTVDVVVEPNAKTNVDSTSIVAKKPMDSQDSPIISQNNKIEGNTKKLVAEIPFSSSKGVNVNWMIRDFNPADVRASFLTKEFSWIRQRAMVDADLKKIKNKSELQFLAIWLSTAAGYQFRDIVQFNKDQTAFLLSKEPYLAESVQLNSVMDPQILVELDMLNLQKLHDAFIALVSL